MGQSLINRIWELHRRFPWLGVFLFSFAVIFGPAFALFSEYAYDLEANPDIASYLNVAESGFDESPVRRYRVIIPFLAAAIHAVFHPLFNLLRPWTFPGPDFAMGMSFFAVNMVLMSAFGTCVYLLCKECKTSSLAAIIGLLTVLTSRWTAYFAGLPLVDGFYLLIIGLLLLGILKKNEKIIIACVLLGPWAKESFIFWVPILYLYAPVNKFRLSGWLFLSGVLVFGFRYYWDWTHGVVQGESLSKDLDHFNLILPSLKRLFSFHGIYEVISIFGLWGLLFFGILASSVREKLWSNLPSFALPVLGIVFLHAILSTDLARMFYLATPILAMIFGLVFDGIRRLGNHKL